MKADFFAVALATGLAASLAQADSSTPDAVESAIPAVNIEVDPASAPIKDLATLKAGAGFGFNGDLAEGTMNADWFYNTHRDETSRAFSDAGVRLVRMNQPVIRYQGDRADRVMFAKRFGRFEWGRRALDMTRSRGWTPPENLFGFFKERGMKAMLCLDGWVYDPETDAMTGDDETVERVILDYLKWIRDSGYADVVMGVELENEPYFGRTPPKDYARRWNRIVPKIHALWPDLDIGLPIAIYMQNDPDLEAVRRRGELTDGLDAPGLSPAHYEQWTGNAIVSLNPETLACITHVQIHTYGADGWYTANYGGGIQRIRRMLKIYPELAGRHFWVTEWRDRSDEDWLSHRRFTTTLWKAQYLQMAVAQPDVDATFLHENGTCAGNLYQSNGRTWMLQQDIYGQRGHMPDTTGDGRWRLDVGSAGPLFRFFGDALRRHPHILAHGDEKGYGFNANTRMYDADVARRAASRDGKELPPRATDLTWLVARADGAGGHPSFAFLLVNTHEEPRDVTLSVKGCAMGQAWFHFITCEKGLADAAEMPGEPKPWKVTAYQGGLKNGRVTVPAQSIAVIEVAVDVPANRSNPDIFGK